MSVSAINSEFDVIVIGGGATGAGTARDCALRGLNVLLLERFDYTNGATGRNHGLLHSGARYVVNDGESARECIEENQILRKIAAHCVEDNDGLFISLPEDDLSYQNVFVEKCLESGISAEIISPEEAILMEPSVNPSLIGAVKVPDGSIDPFRLTIANVRDALRHGAVTLTYHEVTGLIRNGDKIQGVEVWDHDTHTSKKFYAPIVVNACGIWGHHVARMADININMFPAKGALLVYGHRVNSVVLNRCRKAADADILVPGDTITVIGTTSTRVPYEEVDHMHVTAEEVALLRREGAKLAPILDETRILRAYAGVRPLVAEDNDPSGRNISRGIVLLDHAKRDGLEGLITITGGKLITYRLMAEQAVDLICKKMNVDKPCRTATLPLPGSEMVVTGQEECMAGTARLAASLRHGDEHAQIPMVNSRDKSLICECEKVSLAEVNYALEQLQVHDLVSLRRRTRMGMGTCQGQLCACRASAQMARVHGCPCKAKEQLRAFINERWKGMRPVAWGDSLREAQFMAWVYSAMGPASAQPKGKDVAQTAVQNVSQAENDNTTATN